MGNAVRLGMTYDSLAVRILLSDAPEHVKRA